MTSATVTEIVEFSIVDGISDEEFSQRVDFLEKNFHSQQHGFIDTELLKGKDDRHWIMIQHWASMDDAKEAIKRMMKLPVTEEFRQAINPATVKMLLLTQVKTWHSK